MVIWCLPNSTSQKVCNFCEAISYSEKSTCDVAWWCIGLFNVNLFLATFEDSFMLKIVHNPRIGSQNIFSLLPFSGNIQNKKEYFLFKPPTQSGVCSKFVWIFLFLDFDDLTWINKNIGVLTKDFLGASTKFEMKHHVYIYVFYLAI